MGGTREEGMSGEFDQNNAKEVIFFEARCHSAHLQSHWGGEPKAALRLTGL